MVRWFGTVFFGLGLVLAADGVVAFGSPPAAAKPPVSLVDEEVVFAEVDGLVAVEAEHFFRQTHTERRAFYLTSSVHQPDVRPDGDAAHVAGAGGGAYLEILPDTRRTHGDKLIRGTNFSPQPGKLAVVSYRVHFQNAGRYYVWVRAYSTGSEDNGLHVGLNGEWPESGQRLQWCEGKQTWRWESKQRTNAQHCGEPHQIFLDVPNPGTHVIRFSMREDGFEFDRWLMTKDRNFQRPVDVGPAEKIHAGQAPSGFPLVRSKPVAKSVASRPASGVPADDPTQIEAAPALRKQAATRRSAIPETGAHSATSPTVPVSKVDLVRPRQPGGDGSVTISGEQKTWHKVTLTFDGPYAHEQDNHPNPFTDYRLQVQFQHADGTTYDVPGFFAADGNAGESSAQDGTKWRVHFAPDRPGRWQWKTRLQSGPLVALDRNAPGRSVASVDGKTGRLQVSESDKQGRDFRAHGRLQYTGKRYLQFAGSKQYFLKAGADAPETLLACVDFDNTVAGNEKKSPLKTWQPHERDWQKGDPTWKDGKGKGLIGAINYLSGKGCNAFSFLTYNAGGDGDNVWPFIHRDDKLHYDCSKLDQWGIVFDHGTARGMYLHFKMQETENDDHRRHRGARGVPESLDGGNLGTQRKLYCRELIARFGHNLALNWNLGEENTQTTQQQQAMIDYLAETDPYDHNIVIHTFPNEQDKVYRPLLGDQSELTGVSLQNSAIQDTHVQTVKWVQASQQAGRPWVVAFDESGSAAHGQCPDLGYRGFDGRDKTGRKVYTEHEVRHQTLWGTLMGGGAGVEYYFGYQFVENDLVCEDWRSRDRSWDYCRIALNFFRDYDIPFVDMQPADELVGNPSHDNSRYCLAKRGSVYLVYLPPGRSATIDLSDASGKFSVHWFNPRIGGELISGGVKEIAGGSPVPLGPAPDPQDWVVLVRRDQ